MPAISATLKSKFRLIFSGSGKQIEELAKAIVAALRGVYPIEVQQHKEVIRAFVLFTARDPTTSNSAYSWLQGVDVEGTSFGPAAKPRDVIRGLSWLMSLTGPTLLVVDQIDAIVSVHNHALCATESIDEAEERKALTIIDELAGGLMDLRDITSRTVTVLSALEATWAVLEKRAGVPVTARFRDPDYIRPIDSETKAQSVVIGRLRAAYDAVGFVPSYPSWPFHSDAFNCTIGWLPRTLLRRCDAHLRKCLSNGHVLELTSFEEANVKVPTNKLDPSSIDETFHQLRERASTDMLLDPATGETLLPTYCWMRCGATLCKREFRTISISR